MQRNPIFLGAVTAMAIASSASAGLLFERSLAFNGDDGPFSDFGQQIADSFSLTADGTVDRATWYGNYLGLGDPFDTGDTWDFTVRMFADNGGIPQDNHFYEVAVTAGITDDGIQQFNDRIYLFTADLTPVDLGADTTYFFMVLSSTNSSFRWNNGEPTDGLLTFRTGDGEEWITSPNDIRDSSAFTLESVPAPGALALLAIAGLTRRRRRR